MTRLVDDSGWSIGGGFDTLRQRVRLVRRSCTICRAAEMSVPGSKIEHDRRQPGHRLGADLVEPGDAVEQVLLHAGR